MSRGMTLVECLMAMAIVVISAGVMIMSIQGGLAAQEDALALTLAGTAAESRVADYLARPYATIAACDDAEVIGHLQGTNNQEFSDSYEAFGRRTVVTASTLTVPDFPGLEVPGWLIDVEVYDIRDGAERKLASLKRFRPRTIEEETEAEEALP